MNGQDARIKNYCARINKKKKKKITETKKHRFNPEKIKAEINAPGRNKTLKMNEVIQFDVPNDPFDEPLPAVPSLSSFPPL